MRTNLRALAAAGLALLGSACTRDTEFSITKTFDPVSSAGSPATYTATEAVDMATEAGSGWKHRDKVKSIDLVGLDGTMTANHSGVATTGSGSIVLSRAGFADLTVGTWTNHPIPAAAPDSIAVVLSPVGIDMVKDALKGDGKFSVTFQGSTAAPVNFAADVTLHLKMKFKYP
jgi:hypothetical protein